MAVAQQSAGELERHLAAARAAQAQTNCHVAAQEYEAAVRLMPSSGELCTNLGIALYCDKQFSSAAKALHAALHLAPGLPTPHLFLGLTAYNLAELPAARNELTLFLSKAPNDATAHLWLGYTLVAQGKDEAAANEFERVLQQQPANLDAEYALGQASLEVGRQRAGELQRLAPDGPAILRLAAYQYHLQGNQARADAALTEAQEKQTAAQDPAVGKRVEALSAEAQAWETKAQEAFLHIQKVAPDSYRAHQIMADSFVAMQQQQAAIPEYEAVIQMNPTLPGVHESLSQCYMTAGRFADALNALRAEQALTPVPSARLLTGIGQVQMSMGDNDAAAVSLQSALKDPQVPDLAYLLLGRVLLQQGHAQSSIPMFQHYLAAEPNSSAAYYSLARAYRTTGDRTATARALNEFKRTSEDAKARALVAPTLHAEVASLPEEDPGPPASGGANSPLLH